MMNQYVHARDVAAIALVGGEGARLAPYTWVRAKPAVQTGNTILSSFSTSNAENSGIDKIVLAAQHLPRGLRKFYSTFYGTDFGPDRRIDMTDPNEFQKDDPRYHGTADAFWKAMTITRANQRRYILGLSGDHIYKFDFQELFDAMPEQHQNADFVILTQEVSREDAPRFGILFTDGNKVVNFMEKPKELPGRKKKYDASLGIYFAKVDIWEQILQADRNKLEYKDGEKDPLTQTEHDLGKDVIPELLRRGYNVHSHRFNGYWRDVGVPKALYDSIMDIFIRQEPPIIGDPRITVAALYDPQFRVDGEKYFTCGKFDAHNSRLNGSVFSSGVRIRNAEVRDSILMGGYHTDTVIGANSVLRRAMLDKEVITNEGVELIGTGENIIMVAKATKIPAGTKIQTPNDAIVAPLEEMVGNANNLIKFRREVSSKVELYTPDGRMVTFEELTHL